VKRLGELCRGVTDARGLLPCAGKTAASGQLVLQARIQDDAGHAVAANQEVWVAGSEEWWFDVRDSDRIDVLPEQKRYEPGQTARLQVRMPFREATALVTVEREGILDAMVVPLSGREPLVTLPLKDDYAPMSSSRLRGARPGGGVQPTAMVDLGRPAHKWASPSSAWGGGPRAQGHGVAGPAGLSGAGQVAGEDPGAHRRRQGPPRGRVAFADVDEGLLELARNPSWDLLEGHDETPLLPRGRPRRRRDKW
jgi:hypothetical protein